MKPTVKFTYLLLSAALSGSMYSCSDSAKESIQTGQEINFIAGSASSADSKTIYSGVRSGEGERIDWQYTDIIRIYCEQASDPPLKRADYAIDAGSITTLGSVSEAKIQHTRRIGLHWGDLDKDHEFYAVCPSPETDDGLGDVLGNGSLKGHIPAVQTPVSVSAGSGSGAPTYVAAPDMSSMYLVARTTIEAGIREIEGVFLRFTPITTAIEFTITNGADNGEDLPVSSVTVSRDGGKLSGIFTSDLASWNGGYPTCTPAGSNTGSVSCSFDTPVTLEKGESLRFTMFFVPGSDLSGLTFKLDRSDGSWVSTKLEKADGTAITFPSYKKSYISGIMIPQGASWILGTEQWVTSWQVGTAGESVELK